MERTTGWQHVTVAYLGPAGSFTHQAASTWALRVLGADEGELVPDDNVSQVFDRVATRSAAYGVVAIESTVEGYVVPSLDAIVSSPDVVAVDEAVVDISFDAFVRADHGTLTEIVAHPHGLAQCQRFAAQRGLPTVQAASNAAACRDIAGHQVALGPAICGELYELRTLSERVEDFAGARTRFLVLVHRDDAPGHLAACEHISTWRTMVAITPTATGPGVLARITAAFGARGVNMSSLITRPIKAVEGKYVFVVTVDGAPWEPAPQVALRDLLAAGDSLKTLGVVPRRGELDDAVHQGVKTTDVPVGSVRADFDPIEVSRGLLWASE